MSFSWVVRRAVRVTALLGALVAAGCGGQSDSGDDRGEGLPGEEDSGATGDGASGAGAAETSAACSAEFSACGGDVVGTWSVVEICGEMSLSESTLAASQSREGCEDLIEDVSMDVAGTLTFGSDGTLNRALTGGASITMRMTPTCAVSLGVAATEADTASGCAALDAAIDSAASEGTSGQCAIGGEDCLCTSTSDMSQATDAATTYSVSGTLLRMGDDAEPDPYCVSGDTLVVGTTENPELRLILARAP